MEIFSAVSYLSSFLTILYVIVVVTFIKGWHSLMYFKPGKKEGKTRVSILVAARNEETNISKTVDDLLAQNYNKELTEIIFIDDHSTDRTAEIIRSYSNRGVKLICLNEDQALNSYKKRQYKQLLGNRMVV
ncbi:glycosyltransferase [Pedobacter steynii]